MPFIAWHPNFKLPLPAKHRFPMIKYELLHDKLLYTGIAAQNDFYTPKSLDTSLLNSVHSKSYWERLLALDLNEDEIRRSGFPLSKQLLSRELHIAQGTLRSALTALETGIGFNVAGGTHHAGSNWAEGFCLLNDQAIAARYLLNQHSINKILIIDLDVHQGNGTAEIFRRDKRIFTFSMHGANNFTFRKKESDLDVGLPDDTECSSYLYILKQHINYLMPTVQPDFVFYQAGADVLHSDKMGRLNLSQMDCKERDRMVFEACKALNIPVQVSMGGGYSEDIKKTVSVHCQTFEEGINTLRYSSNYP